MQNNINTQPHHQHSLSSLQLISLHEPPRSITLNATQLIELIHHNNKLHHTLKTINAHGITSIAQQQYSQAAEYLNECERILQYAASCGKTIDRSLIIAVLNNQALLYHKMSEIDTAYNYQQAILYNLKLFIDSKQNKILMSQLQHHATSHPIQSQQFITEYFQEIKSLFERKQQLAIFYLRFSGLNSQRQMHSQSLCNALQSVKQMKQLCKLCYYFHRITNPNHSHIEMLMKQLSSIDQTLTIKDIAHLKSQLRSLLNGGVDSQIYNQAYLNLPQQNKQQIMQMDVHELFDLQPIHITDNILQNQNKSISLCSSYFMQIHKILYIMAAYFAIAVETQQIQYPQQSQQNKQQQNKPKQSVTAQIAYLYSLIIGYKYLPSNIKLTNYLYSLYTQNYPSLTSQSASMSQKSDIFQTLTSPSTNKHIQHNPNQLKQKYKNYVVQRDVDLSDSTSYQQMKLKQSKIMGINWQQQKKQSNKLTNLLKQDPNNFITPPNQYLNEVQFMDSFQMANSQSGTIKSTSIGMKTITIEDIHQNEAKKQKIELTLKEIKQCQSQMVEQTEKVSQIVSKISSNPTKIQNQIIFNKKHTYRDISKSKSAKNIKSKSKQPKSKISSKKNISIYTIPSLAAIHSANRKIVSKSKSTSKNKNQLTTTHESECKKIKTEKKITMASSQRIKFSNNMNPLVSVKNYQSIKFNKTKCPINLIQRHNKKTSLINQKITKKQKKSTSSKKMSSESLSLNKSQQKQLNSTSNLKIYTSVGWNKSKKH